MGRRDACGGILYEQAKQLGGCEQHLGCVERAGACRIMKTSPAPGQLCRTQGCRNESAMNGFLCATMTAALSGEGMVRGLRYGQAALSLSVCVSVCARRRRVRVYTGKLPRNARIHAKDKEFESHSREPYPPPRLL